MSADQPSSALVVRENLRPLGWDEIPRRGDFVEDGRNGFESWAGPAGFRADMFIKQIFRQQSPQRAKAKKVS